MKMPKDRSAEVRPISKLKNWGRWFVTIMLILIFVFPCSALVRKYSTEENAEWAVYRGWEGMLEQVEIDGSVMRLWLHPATYGLYGGSKGNYNRMARTSTAMAYESFYKTRIEICKIYYGEKLIWTWTYEEELARQKELAEEKELAEAKKTLFRPDTKSEELSEHSSIGEMIGNVLGWIIIIIVVAMTN